MRVVFFVLLIIGLIGCATVTQPKYHIQVDSIASIEAASKKTYILLPGNQGVTWDDLQFQEYAMYLMRLLHAQGYVLAKSPEQANLAIILSYGIGDPQTRQYTYTLPTWGQTGVSSSSTFGTATTFGNTTSLNATTTYTPTYGVTGYNSYTGTETTYFRYAFISGYDFDKYKKENKQVQLWQTTITSSGSSGGFKASLPNINQRFSPIFGCKHWKKNRCFSSGV